MPIYEFQCLDCQQDFESYCPNVDMNMTCEYCGSINVRKLIPSAVHYRFYTIRESVTNKINKDQANKSQPYSEAYGLLTNKRDVGNIKKGT